ncbi:MAG: hypothetical protein VKS61_06405 [Candidatus Sericytochromatia bacterium]|nr:hypothetical protein [Candidatus Sericytochromatia bacterium]
MAGPARTALTLALALAAALGVGCVAEEASPTGPRQVRAKRTQAIAPKVATLAEASPRPSPLASSGPVGPARGASEPPPGAPPPLAGASAAPPAVASPLVPAALAGRVALPAHLLADRGNGLIGDRGGSLISDAGSRLIGDRGGGIISDGVGRLGPPQQVAFRLQQAAQPVPVSGALVVLVDAAGEPVLDGSGKPYTATTDAQGRYAFAQTPADRALVAVCQLPGQAAQAAVLVPRATREANVDVASTLMSAYVLERFARTQADPQASLERLPAELEARTRQATGEAVAGSEGPTAIGKDAAVAFLDGLRQREARLNELYEEVRRVMVVAGQSDLGAGQEATQARFTELVGAARGADGSWHVMDAGVGRLWRIAGGRLTAVGGLGGAAQPDGEPGPTPAPGARALDVRLQDVVAMALDSAGRPLLLAPDRLDRLEADGTLVRLWTGDGMEEATKLIPMPERGVLVVTETALIPVGGASLPATPPTTGFMDVVRTASGEFYYLVGDTSFWGTDREWWRAPPGGPATRLTVPAALTEQEGTGMGGRRWWIGLDDDGWLAVCDDDGNLTFQAPDGATADRMEAATTGRWPSEMRAGPVITQFGGGASGKSYPNTAIGGSRAAGRWLLRDGGLGLIEAGGALRMVAGDGGLSPGTGDQTPSALREPLAALWEAADRLIVIESSSRQVLRVVNRVASALAGVPWAEALAYNIGPGPTDYNFQPGGTSTVLRFGTGYQAPAREAYFMGPQQIRLAPDGALWVLDAHLFLRRVVGDQLTTLAVKSSAAKWEWVDMWPTSATDGVVLMRGSASMRLVGLANVNATASGEAVFPKPAGWSGSADANGLARLPDGAWLVRAYGQTWRYSAGSAPTPLGAAGVEAQALGDAEGSRLAVDALGRAVFAGARNLYRVDLATGRYTAFAGPGTAVLAGELPDTGLIALTGVAMTPAGDLLVVDRGARQVKQLPAATWPGTP